MNIRETKKVIYTVITDRYDFLFPPTEEQKGFDLICFTDDETLRSDIFDVRPLPDIPEIRAVKDPVRKARLTKILAHKFLAEYDYSVYMDANRVLDGCLESDIERFGGDILCFQGAYADAYSAAAYYLETPDSADPIKIDPRRALPEDEKALLRKQLPRWKRAGLGEDSGCPGTALLGRWHNKPKVAAVMETWAREVINGCHLDEISFPFACYKNKFVWTEGRNQFPRDGQIVSDAEELAVAVPHRKLIVGDKEPETVTYPENPPKPGGKYDGYPLLLTVGVPVSNQIGTIRRCLEHLKPLLSAIDSELVVVDTGSTDGTVEVCLEYGARVVKFPWIDDMSAARNQAVRNAKGRWFMSVDDDEWFDDVTPIIQFFKSGDYKDFDFAVYYQRNYSKRSNDAFEDYPARRLAKMEPSLHFEGRIHDTLITDGSHPVQNRQILAYANHYGFASDSSAEQILKTKRNISILKYDLALFPDNTRFGYQMVREYRISVRLSDAYRMAYFVISRFKASSDKSVGNASLCLATVLYTHTTLMSMSAWEQLERFSEKFLDRGKINDFDKCMVLYTLILASVNLKEYRKADGYLTEYFKYRKKYNKLSEPEQKSLISLTGVNYASELRHLVDMLQFRLLIYATLGRRESMRRLFKTDEFIECFQDRPDFRVNVINYLLAKRDRRSVAVLIDALQKADLPEYISLSLAMVEQSAVSEDIPHIRAAFSPAVGAGHGIFSILDLREMTKTDDFTETYRRAYEFVRGTEYDAGAAFRVSLLSEVFRLGIDPGEAVELFDTEQINYLAARLGSPDERTLILYRSLDEWRKSVGSDSSPAARYMAMRVGDIAFPKMSKKDPELYLSEFENLISSKSLWDEMLYRPEVIANENALLPFKNQSVRAASEAFSLESQKDYAGALRALRSALRKDPALKEPAKALRDRISKKAERELKGQDAAAAEFALLLRGAKQKVSEMIASGQYGDALPLLAQLTQLAPDDAEIKALGESASRFLQ